MLALMTCASCTAAPETVTIEAALSLDDHAIGTWLSDTGGIWVGHDRDGEPSFIQLRGVEPIREGRWTTRSVWGNGYLDLVPNDGEGVSYRLARVGDREIWCSSGCATWEDGDRLRKVEPEAFGKWLYEGLHGVTEPRRFTVRTEMRELHASLPIVDLHSDALLWGHDIIPDQGYTHTDLPRLRDGGVLLQGFSVATHLPALPIHGLPNPPVGAAGDFDLVGVLARANNWPSSTYDSRLARALTMAQRLESTAALVPDQLVLVRNAADLERLLERRAQGEPVVGGILTLEGAHALDGDLDNVAALIDAGFRSVGLSHYVDNDYAGSSSVPVQTGLTNRGACLVELLEREEILVDLAHASDETIDDVLAIATRPILVSHTGLRGYHDDTRNIGDDQAVAIATAGGVIGLAGFEYTIGAEVTLDNYVASLLYGIDLVGPEHVALGNDFDGGIALPIDAAGLPLLTERLHDALIERGESADEAVRIVGRVTGQNVIELLRENLPAAERTRGNTFDCPAAGIGGQVN